MVQPDELRLASVLVLLAGAAGRVAVHRIRRDRAARPKAFCENSLLEARPGHTFVPDATITDIYLGSAFGAQFPLG